MTTKQMVQMNKKQSTETLPLSIMGNSSTRHSTELNPSILLVSPPNDAVEAQSSRQVGQKRRHDRCRHHLS